MKTSESIREISAALLKVQGELEPLERTSENPHFRSRYAGLEAVAFHVLPLLKANGLVITQGCTEDGRSMATRLVHVASGEWIENYYPVRSMDDRPQSWMSATTYARRYGALAIVFGVCEDDDGERAEGRDLSGHSRGAGDARREHHSNDWQDPTTGIDDDLESLAAIAPPPDDSLDEPTYFPPKKCSACGGTEFWREFKGKPLTTKNGHRYVTCKNKDCKRNFGEDGGAWGGK